MINQKREKRTSWDLFTKTFILKTKTTWLYSLAIVFNLSIGFYLGINQKEGFVFYVLCMIAVFTMDKAYDWRKKQEKKLDDNVVYCYNESEANDEQNAPT